MGEEKMGVEDKEDRIAAKEERQQMIEYYKKKKKEEEDERIKREEKARIVKLELEKQVNDLNLNGNNSENINPVSSSSRRKSTRKSKKSIEPEVKTSTRTMTTRRQSS